MLGCSMTKVVAVGMHFTSVHSNQDIHYNEFNPGFYVRNECNIQAGAFYNSFSRMSYYAGYQHRFLKTKLFDVYGFGGFPVTII